jgi:hypothetical protein
MVWNGCIHLDTPIRPTKTPRRVQICSEMLRNSQLISTKVTKLLRCWGRLNDSIYDSIWLHMTRRALQWCWSPRKEICIESQ